MKKMVTLSLAALMSTATLGMAAPAAAQPGYYNGGYDAYSASYDRDHRRYDRYDRRGDRYDRRDYRNDRRYYQGSRRNYRQCDNGTGGTVIGAIAGGLFLFAKTSPEMVYSVAFHGLYFREAAVRPSLQARGNQLRVRYFSCIRFESRLVSYGYLRRPGFLRRTTAFPSFFW